MLMAEPAFTPFVDTANAADEHAFDSALQVWSEAERLRHERIRRALKREDQFQHRVDLSIEQMHAAHAARAVEYSIRAEFADTGDDCDWNPKRALDVQDFAYLFLNRNHFTKQIRSWLEIVSAKINHLRSSGKDGYFKKLEKNFGWTPFITPLLFCRSAIVDKIVRCGIWAHAKNSRRCHQTDFCPLCLWNDVLKALATAFGVSSGAFSAAPAWFLITLGWTTNPTNATCRSDDYVPAESQPHARDRGYDPFPVVLGLGDEDPDAPYFGYEDARSLGIVMQNAIAELYHAGAIDGYHAKLECEFRLNPGHASRVNFHQHTVVNARDDDGQYIAENLSELVKKSFELLRYSLTRDYFPDIHVQRITDPEHLCHAICYAEKVVPINHVVADALARPEARGDDGFYCPRYIARLKQSLTRLIDDDIPALFSQAREDYELPRLFRRRTEGNLKFNDKGTCIGIEPIWHIQKRQKAAKLTRQSRERTAKREKALRDKGIIVPKKKKYIRRRKGSRRLPRIEHH